MERHESVKERGNLWASVFLGTQTLIYLAHLDLRLSFDALCVCSSDCAGAIFDVHSGP